MQSPEKYKNMLLEEQKQLEAELKNVGYKNADNPADWVPKPEEMNVLPADENETSDTIREYEENSAILKQLEIRYNEIKAALERIENGTYGICEVSGKPIPTERLDANPAARTLTEYADEVLDD